MNKLPDLLQELVSRHSVTPQDAGCQDFIAESLAPFDFVSEPFPCQGVSNLWLRRGNTLPLLVFAGHTDVVPVGDNAAWSSPPFEPTIKGQHLYGRGAADMKGGIAAMIHACQTFIQHHPEHPGSIGFVLTSDEEGPAIHGTRHLVQELAKQKIRFNWCILGEPSSNQKIADTIRYGRRGSLTGKLTIQGKQGHVAYPDKIKNPIAAIGSLLTDLSNVAWDAGNEHFPPTSFQWYRIHADAQASNVVPGTLVAEFNLRFSPESSMESIAQRVEQLCRQQNLNYHLDWHLSAEPFLTQPGELTQKAQLAVEKITGYTPKLSTGGGTSDGRFIVDVCDELIELGPDNATIHQVDEHVSLDDLATLSSIYQNLMQSLLLKR